MSYVSPPERLFKEYSLSLQWGFGRFSRSEDEFSLFSVFYTVQRSLGQRTGCAV